MSGIGLTIELVLLSTILNLATWIWRRESKLFVFPKIWLLLVVGIVTAVVGAFPFGPESFRFALIACFGALAILINAVAVKRRLIRQ